MTDATKIFQRFITAAGGEAAMEEAQVIRICGVGQEGRETFDFELTFKAPGKILFTGGHDGQVIARMGRDNRALCWRQDPAGVRDLDGKQAGELMNLALALNTPAVHGLSQRVFEMGFDIVRDAEHRTVALVGRGISSRFPRLVFDEATGLLSSVDDMQIDEYRLVGGLKLPHLVRQGERSVFRVREVQLNPAVDDAIFERPGGTSASDRVDPVPELGTRLSTPGKLEIVRHPAPANFGRGRLAAMPRWDSNASREWRVDLRGYDLSELDLTEELDNLMQADFDSVTSWPDKLPKGFDRQRILELGRDPGLDVRLLHARGITGRGVGIGILDQPLLVDHVEYRHRLRLYEEIHSPGHHPAQMHGPAVASIAVGRSVGVAPEADLYYIAEQHGVFRPGGGFDWDFRPLAKSIDRLIEVNEGLPLARRIRVISVSVGWSPQQKGYAETMAAVERATRAGVFVVSTAIEATHRLKFHGLNREVDMNPNDFSVFGPGLWWQQQFWNGARFAPGERLLVPMDSRAVASPTGPEDYVFYRSGGWSWSVPWIAGLYALACQVCPDMSPELFWSRALETGRTIRIAHNGEEVEFGTLADPVALMEAITPATSR